ncbi:MAG: LCP family protein, partial [Oscillospiraceae bacterium]
MPRYQNEKKGFEDLSSFSSKNEYMRTKKAKGKRHRGVKITIVVVCSLLILLGGGAIFASQYLFGGLTTTSITKDKDKLGIASDTADHDDITNIALFGLDSRDDSLGEGNRSDVIMILTLDQKHTKVKLTSILRDSRVYMGENYINTDSGYDRINHAYAFGGPELAIKALNLNFHLNILDYVVVDFTRMTAIVNAFGGIDLQITDGEVDEINANLGEIIRKDLG